MLDTTTSVLLTIITCPVISLMILRFYQKATNGVCRSKRRLDGKTAIVTGGSAGMGLIIATDLAQRGAKVIIACPFEDEGAEARKNILENSDGNEKVIFRKLDLACLDSVRKFSEIIMNTEDRLDIVMNNAGVGLPGNFVTDDGINFILQVNYFGHFLLTILLLPLLKITAKTSGPCRIINTSSVLHQIGKLDVKNMVTKNYWNKIQIYGNSKFFLVLFANELTRRLQGSNVVVNNIDPGNVGTRIFDSVGWFSGHFMTFLYKTFFKTPHEGAQTAIYACVDEKTGEISGAFFKDCKISRAINACYDNHAETVLWNESVKLVKLNEAELKRSFD